MSENAAMHRELFWTIADKKIGEGWTREVFDSKVLPNCVIKVEDASGRFQNVQEWDIWQKVVGTPYSRWFAECKWISPSGSILIMEKTRTPAPHEYPDLVPSFFTDMKRTNFGMSGKWLVAHDYGVNLLTEKGLNKRMKKAHWWDA